MTSIDDGGLRAAEPRDIASIGALIRELALYERAVDEAVATDAQLHDAIFGEDSHVHCHVVEVNGEVVGMALWFLNFSTWLGTPGIYLEDLFVRAEHRGNGYGRQLMRALAGICVERGYSRFQWSVLDWNTPSIDFYRSFGAEALDEWTMFRLSGEALQAFAP
ncbi:MAG TPA: GNAT family N-acetyltransferase [Acidimicrobiales bacterium]